MEGKVNWDEVTSGSYVQLEEGVPKKLTLKNWKPQTTFKFDDGDQKGEAKPGVEFDVYAQDNATYDEKTCSKYTVCAKGALKQFAPICQKAEAKEIDTITVNIVAVECLQQPE